MALAIRRTSEPEERADRRRSECGDGRFGDEPRAPDANREAAEIHVLLVGREREIADRQEAVERHAVDSSSSSVAGSRDSATTSSRASEVGCGPGGVKHETQVIAFPVTSRNEMRFGPNGWTTSSSAKLRAPVLASRVPEKIRSCWE